MWISFVASLKHLANLPLLILFGTLVVLGLGLHVNGSPSSTTTEVNGLAKEKVVLPCQLNEDTCGPIHSIKWYRADHRVYIFSESNSISRAEGDLSGRAELRREPNNSLVQLEINPLMTADEDLYKCEVTYLEAKEHCALLQSIRLNTFAKPENVQIQVQDVIDSEASNASMIGPFNEGNVITLICIAGGGKPVAQLDWFNSSSPLEGQYRSSASSRDDGTGVASSQLQITLTRGDLGAKVECRASNPTLSNPMIAWVEVDVYVRPATWEVTGYDGPVLSGTVVTLLCRVKGARPAATITWFNGTRPISHQPPSNLAVQSTEVNIVTEIIEADGTYETQSRLSFVATRYDNGIILDCQTSNLVMEKMGEVPYRSPTSIQVNYKPLVTVAPANTTVNETSDILLSTQVDANPAELISVRWYRNGELLEVSGKSHYEGGTPQDPSLLIKNTSREDLGIYTVVIQNGIGETTSEIKANVNILYKPGVKLSMDPPRPVKEQDKQNVTLSCDIESGNPEILDAVRWYLDGDLLKELPECPNSTNDVQTESSFIQYSDLCDIDPSKLMLENVERKFEGNYTCQGLNRAGWGPVSPPTKLHVHYPPGPARLDFEPLTVVKGQVLALTCRVDELGNPPATVYRWTRGNHGHIDISSYNWTIFPVSLETRANFSCEAVNEAGHGLAASVPIDVFVPPTFIDRLLPYYGEPWNAKDIKVSCQVECHPQCHIYWLKDGLPIQSNLYFIKNTTLPPDPAKSDFESVVSTLTWNMTAWPNGHLDRVADNANYTCQSTNNHYGAGVSSTTHFQVEYPPEDITVTPPFVNVIENEIPDEIKCSSKAFPEATYTWKYGNSIVSTIDILRLDYPMKRAHGGNYTCIASNRHGNVSIIAKIDVQYIPECKISLREVEESRILSCEVAANPTPVEFRWMLDNNTYTEKITKRGSSSQLILIPGPEYFGKYKCFAWNSVGESLPCDHSISGNWMRKLSDNTLIIFAGVAVGVLALFVIACFIIFCVCRRRRMSEKHHNTRPEERQNPEGRAYISTYDASPSLTTNFTSTSYTHFSDPSPAHRKGDLSDDGKAFYENLPFHGMQSPQSKTLLTPLSLQYHHTQGNNYQHHIPTHLNQYQHCNSNNHNPHPPHHQNQQQYATTHRTFPSAQASDLIFSSLNRKPGGRCSSNSIQISSDAIGLGLVSQDGGGGRGGGRHWYTGGNQGPIHHPGLTMNGVQTVGHAHSNHSNGGINSNGFVHTLSSSQGGAGGTPSKNRASNNHANSNHHTNGLNFPLIRGSEINV